MDHVRAIVRFRPPLTEDATSPSCWAVDKASNTVSFDAPEGAGETGISAADRHKTHKYTAVYTGEDSNATVFERSVKPLVDACVEGKNACVLCYGQTGSGKTHTMFGYDAADGGFVPQAVRFCFDRFAAMKRSTRVRCAVSFYEIYNESVSDLLATSSGENLPVREVNKTAYVDGLTIRMCHNAASVLKLVEYGSQNKTVGNSYLHDKSSRAHTVFTIQLATEQRTKDVIATRISRMSFVDLAGSEMLSDKFGAEQQKETKAINLSLFSLSKVISALAIKESFIPFRDSVLTRLLAPCLSENSVTAVLCTCSPVVKHSSLSNGTLKFGDVSRMIEQKAHLNEIVREGARKIRIKEHADEEVVKIGGKAETAGAVENVPICDAEATMHPCAFDTRQGAIQGYTLRPTSPFAVEAKQACPGKRVALCLHAFGNGCSGADWEQVMRALAQLGYETYAVDFPGFGRTDGARQASRTDQLDNVGGPMEILYDVLDQITEGSKKVKVLVLGWDWGGNMALVLGQGPFRTRVSGIILYHPSYTNKLEELSKIGNIPVLLCWIPTDQLHLYSTGKRMARIMPKSKLMTIQTPAGKGRDYDAVWGAMCNMVAKWVPANVAGAAGKAKPRTPGGGGRSGSVAAGVRAPTPPKTPPGAAPGGDATTRDTRPVRTPPGFQAGAASLEGADLDPAGDSSDEDSGADAGGDDDDDDDALTTESSFLACILCDPAAAAAVVEGRTQTRRRERQKAREVAAPMLAPAPINGAAAPPENPSDPQRPHWFVSQLREVLKDDAKAWAVRDALQGRNNMGRLRPQALALVGGLPPVLPHAKATELQLYGLWPEVPRGNAFEFSRYAVGRQIMVNIGGTVPNFTHPAFGLYDKGNPGSNAKGKIPTFRATISTKTTAEQCVVEVQTSEAGEVVEREVPWRDVFRWNQDTRFPNGPQKQCTLMFEDAITCRYHDVLTKTKMNEIALALAPYVAKMDFDAAIAERRAGGGDFPENKRLLSLQVAAVKAVRKCMDTIHHVNMGKDPKRLCVPDVGRLATHGQWHCHGMASVFAALLIPFAHTLGIEIRYRDGFYYDSKSRDSANSWDGIPRSIADHTWLELTFFPSAVPFVADPSFDRDEGVVVPFDVAYSPAGCRYPVRGLTSGSTVDCATPIAKADVGCAPLSGVLRAEDFV